MTQKPPCTRKYPTDSRDILCSVYFPDILVLTIWFIYFLFNALTSFSRLLQSNKWFLSGLGFFFFSLWLWKSFRFSWRKGSVIYYRKTQYHIFSLATIRKAIPRCPKLNRRKGGKLKFNVHLQKLPTCIYSR